MREKCVWRERCDRYLRAAQVRIWPRRMIRRAWCRTSHRAARVRVGAGQHCDSRLVRGAGGGRHGRPARQVGVPPRPRIPDPDPERGRGERVKGRALGGHLVQQARIEVHAVPVAGHRAGPGPEAAAWPVPRPVAGSPPACAAAGWHGGGFPRGSGLLSGGPGQFRLGHTVFWIQPPIC